MRSNCELTTRGPVESGSYILTGTASSLLTGTTDTPMKGTSPPIKEVSVTSDEENERKVSFSLLIKVDALMAAMSSAVRSKQTSLPNLLWLTAPPVSLIWPLLVTFCPDCKTSSCEMKYSRSTGSLKYRTTEAFSIDRSKYSNCGGVVSSTKSRE